MILLAQSSFKTFPPTRLGKGERFLSYDKLQKLVQGCFFPCWECLHWRYLKWVPHSCQFLVWGTVNSFTSCLSLPLIKEKYDSDHLCKELGVPLMKASHQNYFIMVKKLRFVLMQEPKVRFSGAKTPWAQNFSYPFSSPPCPMLISTTKSMSFVTELLCLSPASRNPWAEQFP